jgi:hypothetical protein
VEGSVSGSGLNITTRVSKNKMDAYTHLDGYPLRKISEKFQFPIVFSLHSTVDVSAYMRALAGRWGSFSLVFPKNMYFLP